MCEQLNAFIVYSIPQLFRKKLQINVLTLDIVVSSKPWSFTSPCIKSFVTLSFWNIFEQVGCKYNLDI